MFKKEKWRMNEVHDSVHCTVYTSAQYTIQFTITAYNTVQYS